MRFGTGRLATPMQREARIGNAGATPVGAEAGIGTPTYACAVPIIVRRLPRAALVALAIGVGLLVAGCTAGGAASIEPSGPCTKDGQQPGAYPELEAHIPPALGGAPPTRLDSGRNCSPTSLGTLAGHGIDELRFAGGVWETGRRSGASIAVFQAEDLTLARLAEFYETGARQARKTDAITTTDHDVDGVDGWRLDTLNDESFQTILLLDGPKPGLVRAVLVASDIREIGTRAAHEAAVDRAAAAAAGATP